MYFLIPLVLEILFFAGCSSFFFTGEDLHGLLRVAERMKKQSEKRINSGYFADLIRKEKTLRRQKKIETELAEALSYVRNMVILGRGQRMSAELLMEELSDISELLRPVFLSMARSFHLNETQAAAETLAEAAGTPVAREIGIFLAGWEKTDPAELRSSVDAFRSTLRESRETDQRRKDETVSDLVYFPVVADCMLVLLNFIYVAYFIEQRQAMTVLFQ